MSQATIGGYAFRINPESASWDYTVKTSETPTVGGVVVQVFGVELSDITVQGFFGSQHLDGQRRLVGGWQEQETFLSRMKDMADRQIATAAPVRFFFPSKGWDYMVKLRSYNEIGQSQAVVASNENFNPTWQLRLFIEEDNSLVRVVQDAALLQYINRLSAGLGWTPGSKYNGPISTDEVNAFVASTGATDVAALLRGLGGGS